MPTLETIPPCRWHEGILLTTLEMPSLMPCKVALAVAPISPLAWPMTPLTALDALAMSEVIWVPTATA